MTITDPALSAASVAGPIAAACDRIAPTWPLDQFIAVNPYWGWRSSSASLTAAHLATLAGTRMTMPRAWFRDEWVAGRLADEQLCAAAADLGFEQIIEKALAVLHDPHGCAQPVIATMALATDVRDLGSSPIPGQAWAEFVTHQISQHSGAHFDRWQGSWHPDLADGLFAGWRARWSASHGVPWRSGRSWARQQLVRLPDAPETAIAMMLAELRIPVAGREAYLTALLLDVNGWAAWCAYLRWQARLTGDDDDEIVGLLAIRLAWEWLLRADAEPLDHDIWEQWAESWSDVSGRVAAAADEQQIEWVLQTAVERTHQASIIAQLTTPAVASVAPPAVQAVFCIDVRSEIIRRALESVSPDIQTRGFAGFFGLPISYTPLASALTRPQLPGLLSPTLQVDETTSTDVDADEVRRQRTGALADRQRWSTFRSAPSSVFTFVESIGLLSAVKLIKGSVAHTHPPAPWEHDGLPAAAQRSLRPRLAMVDDDPAAAAAVAAKVLNAMGLREGFAPIVLLCGHGSQTANNPHAAGLDCGACGGQTGEVNARALADLLNSAEVRVHLPAHGITVEDSTWFLPALHITTTDEIRVLDAERVPDGHDDELARLQGWLDAAGHRARTERAASVGLDTMARSPQRLERAFQERANDWSQVRPEWGLAGNAAFIVAPRRRTRHIDFAGRSFLHDYDWTLDLDLSVLTLIMTAPMVVTNWINMQYHASTVDNRRYGSGNKVLHNVVGGRIGVFEGNGGDLRIGLPMQSLHDGATLRHRPLRLSVFVEAPRAGIDSIIAQHSVVHDLVANGWIHLLRIEPTVGTVERWSTEGWVTP